MNPCGKCVALPLRPTVQLLWLLQKHLAPATPLPRTWPSSRPSCHDVKDTRPLRAVCQERSQAGRCSHPALLP